jgi:hypothetical protein
MAEARDQVEPEELLNLGQATHACTDAAVVVQGASWRDQIVRKAVIEDHLAAALVEGAQIRIVGIDIAELRLEQDALELRIGESAIGQIRPSVVAIA